MRKWIKIAAIYIHTVLLLAIIIPVLYALALKPQEYDGDRLYFLGLLILLPVAATGIAIKRCKSLLLYLAVSIASMCLMMGLAILLGNAVLDGPVAGYLFVLAVEGFVVTLERFLQRSSEDKTAGKGESYEPDYRPRESIFENPHVGVVLIFAAAYLVGLLFANPPLCNQALISAVLYLFAAAPYFFVRSTQNYLDLHKRVGSIPSKRIYGIGSGILAAVLAVLALLTVAAVATSGHRYYTDIREWEFFSEMDDDVPLQQAEWQQMGGGMGMSEQLQEMFGETEPAPLWVEALFWVFGVACVLAFLVAVVQAVRAIFQKFRENFEENGDIVEELCEETGTVKRLTGRKREPRFGSRREQVRYQYRRFIRKHRKGKPEAYETPYEIETFAKVADSAEGKEMHRLYEEVRYGKESRD